MKSNMLKRSIETYTKNMINFYELSGGVDHDGEKGAFREFFVTQLIKPLMPQHFGVGSGVVEDFKGNQSKQTDIIIYDKRLLQPTLLAGDRGIFPIDSVLCVIEVKSELKAYHYRDIAEAARYFYPTSEENPNGLHIARPGKLRGDKGQPQAFYPLFSVFAYRSDADRDEIERLDEQVPNGSYYCYSSKLTYQYPTIHINNNPSRHFIHFVLPFKYCGSFIHIIDI
ncbi:MAG: DUF6602 domain-containing protein, partial [Methanothrix sp.]